jgi:hypothetical protein
MRSIEHTVAYIYGNLCHSWKDRLASKYCDMTTETQNSGTKKRQAFLCSGMVNTFSWQWIDTQQQRSHRSYVFYAVQARLHSEDHPEPSDSKISSRFLWDLEPRIIVLVRNSSNLALRQSRESWVALLDTATRQQLVKTTDWEDLVFCSSDLQSV